MPNGELDIPIKWAQEGPSPLAANVVHLHYTPFQEVILTFGHVSPVLHGSPEEQDRQAENALNEGGFTIRTNARLALPLKTARNLSRYLQQLLKDHDH